MMSHAYVRMVEQDGVKLLIHVDPDPADPREWALGTMVCKHRRYTLGDAQAQNMDAYENWEAWFQGEVQSKHEEAVVLLPIYMHDHGTISLSTTSFNDRWDSGQLGFIYVTKERLREETGYTEDELFSTNAQRVPQLRERVRLVETSDLGNEDEWGYVVDIVDDQFIVAFDTRQDGDGSCITQSLVSVPIEDIVEVMSNKAMQILQDEVDLYNQYLQGDVYGYVIVKTDKCSCCGSTNEGIVESCWGYYGLHIDTIEAMQDSVGSEYDSLFELMKEEV